MSQYDLTFTSGSGAALLAALEEMEDAIHSSHSGATEPSYKVAGTLWYDTTTATAIRLKIYDGTQWQALAVIDPTTDERYAPGQLIRETRFTASDAAFTLHALTAAVEIDGCGGGGGGGGSGTTATTKACAGSGGNAGEEIATGRIPATGGDDVAIAIGAAGSGAADDAGTAGGDTTFEIGSDTYTAKGGSGGLKGTEGAGIFMIRAAAQAPSTAIGAERLRAPEMGGGGEMFGTNLDATLVARGGDGGGGRYGRGGRGGLARGTTATSEGGGNATGRGAGGGGSATIASLTQTNSGGAATAGVIYLREYA